MNDVKEFWNKPTFEDQKWLIAGDCPWEVSERDADAHRGAIQTPSILEHMSKQKTPRVVEIGCGVGRLLKGWKYHAIGIDLSENMIAKAKEYTKGSDNKIDFVVTDGVSLPLKNSSVDFVYAFCVFQHIQTKKEIESYVDEAWRILKPGGYLRVQTHRGEPNDESVFGGFRGRYYPTADAFAADIKRKTFEITEKQEGLLHQDWLWVTARKV